MNDAERNALEGVCQLLRSVQGGLVGAREIVIGSAIEMIEGIADPDKEWSEDE